MDPTPGLGKETIFPLYYNPHSKSGSRVISLKCHYGHLTKIISTSLYVLIYTTNTLYILYIYSIYAMEFELHDTRIMKCKVCDVEVPVNVNYPIIEVTCQQCWAKQKADKK